VNYAGAGAAAGGQGAPRRRRPNREVQSVVWMRDTA